MCAFRQATEEAAINSAHFCADQQTAATNPTRIHTYIYIYSPWNKECDDILYDFTRLIHLMVGERTHISIYDGVCHYFAVVIANIGRKLLI